MGSPMPPSTLMPMTAPRSLPFGAISLLTASWVHVLEACAVRNVSATMQVQTGFMTYLFGKRFLRRRHHSIRLTRAYNPVVWNKIADLSFFAGDTIVFD